MKQAKFVFIFDSVDDAKIVADSLKPEIRHKTPKTSVNLSLTGKKMSLTIDSSDISSLRAASNSYLRWINTAISVKKQL